VRQDDAGAGTTADTILARLDHDGIGWTWWTYREQRSKGAGFAPFWLDDAGAWQENGDWLARISAALTASP
jgi:hypothetical protein